MSKSEQAASVIAKLRRIPGTAELCDALVDLAAHVDSVEGSLSTLRAAIKETVDRWAEETGDGSMWGEDAYVLEPIACTLPTWSPGQKASGDEYRSRVERLEREADRISSCSQCGSQVVLRSAFQNGKVDWCPACEGPESCGPSIERVRRPNMLHPKVRARAVRAT